jgi:hypothetical protein
MSDHPGPLHIGKIMSDELILKREPRELHPEGQFAALCLDVIAMGMRVRAFPGQAESASESCVFVFATGERNSKGQEFSIPVEMTVSMGARASLPKFLAGWRGKPFTSVEMAEGIKLASFVGRTALVSIVNKPTAAGNLRVAIDTIMPLPKGMPPPVVGKYERAPFWAQKKIEYKMAYDQFLGRTMRGDVEGSGEEAADDEVPF